MTDPVVIIGAGRSGTSLLAYTLAAHPGFYMPAEPNFLLAKLFDVMWTAPATVGTTKCNSLLRQSARWRDLSVADFMEAFESSPELRRDLDRITASERARVVEQLRDTFVAVLMPPALARDRWGFKEIWNGHPSHDYPWGLYNEVFPGARWVHIIRDPFEFARSSAGWNRTALDYGALRHELGNWVLMNRRAEEQRATGRYMMLRFEDLIADREGQFARVFDFADLPMHDDCRVAMEKVYVKTPEKPALPSGSIRDLLSVDGLAEMMAAYHYEAPAGA
jgi:hypothetical protein